MEKIILDNEYKLFSKDFCSNLNNLENIFHLDFFEYGKSGSKITRQETIDFLLHSYDRNIKIENFSVDKIDYNTYIAHYIAINLDENISSYRTSIWLNNNGLRLYFHQGTKI